MDINLTRWVSPHWFTGAVSQQLPAGMGILGVIPVALTLQSLQSAVRFAEYRVNVESEMNPGEIQSKVDTLLSVQELPWRHQRDTGERIYDLRRLVEDVWVEEWLDRSRVLGMVLRCDSGGSGRPEQVALALGVSEYPRSIHRMKLTLAVQ